ncbi:hypothetical protein AB4851_24055 [Burkholderia sp. 22PA0099]|uniref:hypothetical protein n=1 Tax=unclassified Burkholderia TaxID=2613784 RepID=UPI0039C45047
MQVLNMQEVDEVSGGIGLLTLPSMLGLGLFIPGIVFSGIGLGVTILGTVVSGIGLVASAVI